VLKDASSLARLSVPVIYFDISLWIEWEPATNRMSYVHFNTYIDMKKEIYATVILEVEDAIKECNQTILDAAEHVKEARGMK
jgi:hypothetical protein